jgi:hypothetical protein
LRTALTGLLVNRRTAIAALLAAGAGCVMTVRALAVTTTAPELLVHLDGDFLRISLPRLDFLKGKPLDRLKDGASVAFIGQLTISTSPNSIKPAARSVARFALSYDIWEERFSVTKIGASPESRRAASHLSAQAAQNWCLDNLTVDRALLPSESDFWVQLDLRAEDPRDQLGIIGEPGINITRLIEIFGRPARGAQPRWLLSSGPFRLTELRKPDFTRTDLKGTRE